MGRTRWKVLCYFIMYAFRVRVVKQKSETGNKQALRCRMQGGLADLIWMDILVCLTDVETPEDPGTNC